MTNALTRPIVGIENRTAQEVFDIMCDRIRSALTGEAVGYVSDLRVADMQTGKADYAGIYPTRDALTPTALFTYQPDQSARIEELEKEVERLSVERDEATALHQASLRRVYEALGLPDDELRIKYATVAIADLKARLVELEGNDRLAMEVIERQKEEVYQANQKGRELEVQFHVLKARLAKAVEVIEPFAEDGAAIHEGWADERRRASLTQTKPLTVAHFRAAAQFVRQESGE